MASLPLQPRQAVKQVRTKTEARTFFSPWPAQGRKCTRLKGVGGLQSSIVGLDRKKRRLQWEGGFGEPLWRGRSRGLFTGMLEVPQAVQTPQLSTGLPALVDAAGGCIRRAREEPARAVLRDAEQSRMQDAKCEESRGFRKGRKKGRAGPRTGSSSSTECRSRYRYGHHSGLLRPGGILGSQPVWHRSAPALAGASQRQAKKGPASCR